MRLENACKAYDKFVAVDKLSFAIPEGTIFGLLGPNGAGKTSTIRMMIGITVPDSGSITMFGEPFRRSHLQRIGYLPEERGLYRKMKVMEQLIFLGELHGLSAADARSGSRRWAEKLEIADWLEKKVEELSKGMQQKIQFIAALLHDPDFMIMDEPFFGLDPVNSSILKNVMLELRKAGKTILFSTHRMDQVEKLCDSICLVNHGKAVLAGELKAVKSGFGRNNVQIECDGDLLFLDNNRLVESYTSYGNSADIKLAPGADAQELLRQVCNGRAVYKFEMVEPSLEEIFIQVVGKDTAATSGNGAGLRTTHA